MSTAVREHEVLDFELLVGHKTPAGHPVKIVHSPAGEGDAHCHLHLDADLQEVLQALAAGQASGRSLDQFGSFLFDRLFTGNVHALYRASLGMARGRNARLRIRLRVEPPELAALPWEYLYDSQEDSFLAISAETPLVRYVPVSAPSRATEIQLPLRLLAILSHPHGLPSLDVAQEKRILDEALAGWIERKQIAFEIVEHATVANINQAMRSFRPHVFHFVGHGMFDAGQAFLVLEDEDENVYPADERTVQAFFPLADETRLAVLNACQTADISTTKPLAGLAPRLLQRQLSAVVAMQGRIPDRSALVFTREFYRSLVLRYPVDVAVAEARKGIFQEIGARWPDWGAPVLFLRARDGQLFAAQAAQAQPEPTPEQFAALVARLLSSLQEIPQGRTLIVGARATLDNTRRQLRLLAEYKETHDLLQRLESSHRVVYALLYDGDVMLPLEQVRWLGLKMSCDMLQESIYKLRQSVAGFSFAADVASWLETLGQASADLQQAYHTRDAGKFDAALADIDWVISTQTSRINDRLIATVDVLRLGDLVGILQKLCAELAHDQQNGFTREHIGALAADVDAFAQLSDRLSLLRTAHDRWQQMDNELRQEQATLTLDLRRFQTRWQRRLGPELRSLSADGGESTQEVAASIDRLDAALAQADRLAVLGAFDECRRAVMLHFVRIDLELRTLCNVLKEAGGPLDVLLERLA